MRPSLKLTAYTNRPDVLVLALPRGGVPVAFAVARALHAQLEVFLVCKQGVPRYEELAMGAIATGGVRVLCCSSGINFEAGKGRRAQWKTSKLRGL